MLFIVFLRRSLAIAAFSMACAWMSASFADPVTIKVTLSGVIPRVFPTRGTFHYNCFVHPGMSGDVIVQ